MGIRAVSLGIQGEVTRKLSLHRHVGFSWGREGGGPFRGESSLGGGEGRLEGGVQDPRMPAVYRAVHRALEGGEKVGPEEAREE